MKILKIQGNQWKHENIGNQCENYKNHENIKKPCRELWKSWKS